MGVNLINDTVDKPSPLTLYRVSWKDVNGTDCQFWTEDYQKAFDKKYEIDHSEELPNGRRLMQYLNFESWFCYKSDVHDVHFGKIKREKGWWER